ncbi:FAD-dependent oxidoreductase [Allokutzneria oryzae]|uniref:FAD-dependent oxidoreductase n=1 Tax=Allokutzneria oryzae TaxID=1378989 RepID=A0ABV6A343_9PSEU
MARVIVCGGSVIGSATAMMLADDGHDVTVLEADPSPVPDDPAQAWNRWERRGVAQFRQPHNLLARVRHVLDEELPGTVAELLEAGCVWGSALASVPPGITDWTPCPEDDRFRFVTGRRPVVEAVLARAAARHPGITVRRGARVRGLLGSPGLVPRVHGVLLHDGEDLRADLVVDATGRLTKLGTWLEDLGGQAPHVESEDSGFVYYSRFFTGPEVPETVGPPYADIGTSSILTIPGDNGTWSISLTSGAKDVALRGLRDTEAFSRVVRACPLQAHWLDYGEPITDVVVTGGILDRMRRLVVDGTPIAEGVVAVGDAWACTNPSAARGLSSGLIHAQQLRAVAREGLDSLTERFDEVTERVVAPFFHSQIANDRHRLAQMDALREGCEPPPHDPMRSAFEAALTQDAEAFRALAEKVQCLAPEQEIFARPGFVERIMAFAGTSPIVPPVLGRRELLALVG